MSYIVNLDKLTSHSFIAKNQSKYLKECKENLTENECIVLGDFSENYQFVMQDEIQSYHWNKEQYTQYYNSGNQLVLFVFYRMIWSMVPARCIMLDGRINTCSDAISSYYHKWNLMLVI